MAKGKKCRTCNFPMYADREEYQQMGTYVTYVCQNNDCPTKKRGGQPEKEKVFEPKP